MGNKSYQKFEDFDLSRKLHEAVLEARLERPTELQQQVIPLAMENRDVIFEARSGMGKSACFAIPFLQHWLRDRSRKGIIITPTFDTVQQLGKVIGRLCPILKAKVLKFTKRDDYFYPEFHEKCPIVILELGVADRFLKREKDFVAQTRSLGLDELDKLLENEQGLEEMVRAINPDRLTLVCANELNEQILEKGRWFCDPNRLEKVKLSRPEAQWTAEQVVLQYALVTEATKFEVLAKLIRGSENQVFMVLTDSDRMSRYIAERLESEKISGALLEYSMQLEEKRQKVELVAGTGRSVLVGCEAALNGLNLPKIDHLVSWDLPSQLESYWKRLDRFAYQGKLYATVLVDQPRAGAIRILEKRVGRPIECLNPEALGTSDAGSRDRSAVRPSPVRTEKRDEYPAAARPSEPVSSAAPSAPATLPRVDELIIPERFRLPVFAQAEELARFAPDGTVKKSLGGKFLPARSKKPKPGTEDS